MKEITVKFDFYKGDFSEVSMKENTKGGSVNKTE